MIAANTFIAARVCRRARALICAALDFVATINSHVMAGPAQTMHGNQLGPGGNEKAPLSRGHWREHLGRINSPWKNYSAIFKIPSTALRLLAQITRRLDSKAILQMSQRDFDIDGFDRLKINL